MGLTGVVLGEAVGRVTVVAGATTGEGTAVAEAAVLEVGVEDGVLGGAGGSGADAVPGVLEARTGADGAGGGGGVGESLGTTMGDVRRIQWMSNGPSCLLDGYGCCWN